MSKVVIQAATEAKTWYQPTTVHPTSWVITTGATTATVTPTIWTVPNSATGYVVGTGAASITGTTYYNATDTAVTANVWDHWVAQERAVQEYTAWRRMHGHHVEVRENEAQRRQREAEILAARRRQEEINRQGRHEAAIARTRAKRLLIENITPAQRKQLKEQGYFEIQVNGRTYRIKWGSHGNVYLVQGGREVRSFCIQPPDTPDGDSMLAQKLLLEADEASFLRIANARDLVRA